MKPALHVLCPECDADNAVSPEQLAAGPTCACCHASLFETLAVLPMIKQAVAAPPPAQRHRMRRWA